MKIIFCLPGKTYSGAFLQCWTNLMSFCRSQIIETVISQQYSPNIYMVRNLCLGGDIARGRVQKPFDGKLDYDYIMWIDSDILFSIEHFCSLWSRHAEIVSGLYLMQDGISFATVKSYDMEYLKQKGTCEFLTRDELGENPFEVAYTGMGFMLIKKGVFEAMEYPWFKPREVSTNEIRDFTTEDVDFCLSAREKGFKVLIDPKVIVGHEKTIIY